MLALMVHSQTTNRAELKILDWDSAFFGLRIGRLSLGGSALSQLPTSLLQADQSNMDCLYWLVDSDDAAAVRAASESNFRLVDIRVTLEARLPSIQIASKSRARCSVRPFRNSDLTELLPIAAASHGDSRFFQDGNFPEERCESLYKLWLEDACVRNERVFVAETGGRASGYCVCAADGERAANISLIAVAREHRGAGAGTALIRAVLRDFEERGAHSITVVTQGRNIASQRLYQRCGFLTQSVQLWFHRWRSEARSKSSPPPPCNSLPPETASAVPSWPVRAK